MRTIDYYKHLDDDDSTNGKLTMRLSMPEVAREICNMNYGAHRLLSAMVHELRRRNAEYLSKNPRFEQSEQSPLANGIEALLNQGHVH